MTVNKKVDIHSSSILNILIPPEFVVCYRNDLPWFNKKIIRTLIQENILATLKNYAMAVVTSSWKVVWDIFKSA